MSDAVLDLGPLGLDRGAHIVIGRALHALAPGQRLVVRGSAEDLAVHLRVWCRARGHAVEWPTDGGGVIATIVRGTVDDDRWHGAERAGDERTVVDHPSARWGLAARGARVDASAPAYTFRYANKDDVWADDAGRLYAQAAAAQWDPATAVDWSAPCELPDVVEDAVVQVMTFLIENETAALMVPARFVAQVHPHFREVLQVLAIQAADEARHMEVFTRRALLRRPVPALSTEGGQSSLKTLVDEPDFALASFFLSVLGEGTFLSLLWFIHAHAPDEITRQVVKLAAQDEARHVAFGLAHLRRHADRDPQLRERLAQAVEVRHQSLKHTAGLNEEVFDALVILAAGEVTPDAIAHGHDRVSALVTEMDTTRRGRLVRLGFSESEAAVVSALHTRNFM